MFKWVKWSKDHKDDPIVYGPVLGIIFVAVVILGYIFVS